MSRDPLRSDMDVVVLLHFVNSHLPHHTCSGKMESSWEGGGLDLVVVVTVVVVVVVTVVVVVVVVVVVTLTSLRNRHL